jgi:opacity protein-like surface antigen
LSCIGASAEEDVARNDRSGPYLTARAGYRVNGWLALEGHYEYMDGQEVKGATQNGELRANIFTFNTRLSLPLEGDTRPYVLLGIGAVEYEQHNEIAGLNIGGSEWDFSGRLGAGIESYLTDHIVFFLEASAIGSEEKILSEHFPLVSVGGGLQYKF